MPSVQRVEEFIAMVVDENHIDAINEFYHESASMQENFNPPRIGKEHLIAHERESNNKYKSMESFPPKSVLIDGNKVAIQWIFEIIDPLGQKRRLEEISLQTWKAEKIIQEQFFYDSAKAWHP